MFGRCHSHGFRRYGYAPFMNFAPVFFGPGFRRPKYNVPVNINDKDAAYEVHVYALGFNKEDIKINVTDDVLYITGTRTLSGDDKPNFTRQEYPVKSFERTIELNGAVETDKISARSENGVLIVTLPKTKEAQTPSREIKIN